MAFDYDNAKIMIKALSPVLTDLEDETLIEALDLNALPRVRGFLLTATDGLGNHLFYDVLSDLTDAGAAAAMESLIDLLMEEASVKNMIRTIAARWAASWLIIGNGGTFIKGELDSSYKLEKQASQDMDRLVKSPLLRGAVASVAAKAKAAAKTEATLYLAFDADPDTIDTEERSATAYTGAALPYVGAPEAGKLGIVVNGRTIEVTVPAGDTPVLAMSRLRLAFESLGDSVRPNINLAVSEVESFSGQRRREFIDPDSGNPIFGDFAVESKAAKISFLPRNYDALQNVVVVTLYASHRTSADDDTYIPGITGFCFGSGTTLKDLTSNGPHAVAVDLEQGKTTILAGAGGIAHNLSDSFFFLVDDDATADDGELVYAVYGTDARTVTIPEGSGALDLVSLVAQDMASVATTQRVLGAVRPSAPITVSGTSLTAPSLEMVAFGLEQVNARIVVTIRSVPDGVTFGVVPSTTQTADVFDAGAKSIVVATTLNRPRAKAATQDDGTSDSTGAGTAHIVEWAPTPSLNSVLDLTGDFTR